MRHPRSVVLGPALAAVLLFAGCGGGGSGDRSSSDTSSTAGSPSASATSSSADAASGSASATPTLGPTSSATGAAFSALSGQEIADTSKAAMLALQSVRYRGNVAASDGSGTITLDLRADATGDCTGQLGVQGGEVTLLAAGGQSYFKGDRKFWKAAAGSAADQIIKGIAGRWVLDTNQDFSQFCDLGQFLGNLFAASDGSTYTVQGTSTLAGDEVVAVQRSTSDQTSSSTGYVVTGPTHYLSRIERTTGDQQGRLDFSDFDQPVSAKAPAPSDVVDPATLGSSVAPSPSPSTGG